MEYELIGRPYMLQETVSMLFKYINGISFKETLTRKRFFVGSDTTTNMIHRMECLQRVMEEVCGELDSDDPVLQHFFGRAAMGDTEISVAQLMTFSFCRIGHPDLHDNAAAICGFWNESQRSGAWLSPQSRDTLLFTEQPGAPEDLFDQFYGLPYPPEFQVRLYRALRNFDQTMAELVELIEPVALRLEEKLQEETWLQEDLLSYWQEIFDSTSPREVAREILGYDALPGKEGRTYVLPMYMNCSFVAFGEDQHEGEHFNLLILGSGATVNSRLRHQSSVMDGLCAILKTISDRRRMEILCRLSKGRSYCYELAEAMGVDASNMSRHLAQLNHYGLLHQEREHMINYYETNKEALLEFFRLVEATILS